MGWLAVPRDWVASLGDIIRFCGQAFGDIFNGRVFHFFGEALRQAGILILGSALVIWGMVFILGLECGILRLVPDEARERSPLREEWWSIRDGASGRWTPCLDGRVREFFQGVWGVPQP